MLRHLLCLALSLVPLAAALAQEVPVPQKRAIYEADVDFYGGDLRAIFDTTLELCRASCEAEGACEAFTYNTRAASCFLKTGVERRDPYVGALSAVMVPLTPAQRETAAERAGELAFLRGADLAAAQERARELALDYPGAADARAQMAEAQAAARGLDFRRAMAAAGRAVARADESAMWRAFSDYAGRIEPRSDAERRELERDALLGAINAHLRSVLPTDRAAALTRLADALEETGRGRESIDALRLAQAAAPAPEIQAAIDRAVALYGFRIVDTQIDSDTASPRVCVRFSERLVAGAVDYGDYVNLPSADLGVSAEEDRLCVDGLSHGTRLEMALRAGLPAQSGEVLNRTIQQSFYIRDRRPSARFPGRAYVLPRSAGAQIPIQTVNADVVEIAIHTIPDAGLRDALREGLVGQQLRGYDEERLRAERGETVWTGTAQVATELNADVTTLLPLGDALNEMEPGVYVMTARLPGAEDWRQAATQWFIVTDLGLSTVQGAEATHVFVRSLATAGPKAGATLRLIARSGAELGRTQTDAQGYARFDAGLLRGTSADAPALISASHGGDDYAFLDMTEAPMDLSDRGVGGRPAPPPVDVFVATDRGAYRPGETVFATILARDARAGAIPGLPLTVITRRPDGVEFDRRVLADQGAGGRALSLALPDAAQRGTWSLAVFADPEAPALARANLLVEDFVPEKIDFDLTLPEGPVRMAARPGLEIDARYLYGAPGAGLAIEGEVRIAAAEGLEDYPGYAFGDQATRVAPVSESLPSGLETDAQGRARVALPLPQPEASDRPLEMRAILRLTDASGRPVERQITRPVAPVAPLIGIRAEFDGAAPMGGEAGFEVIALDAGGGRAARDGLRWQLSRLTTFYQWYELGGEWNYERVTTRERVADGTLDVPEGAPARLSVPVDWGRYELQVAGQEGGYALTTLGFDAGWYAADAGTGTPDRLEVSADRKSYAPGDTARIRIEAPGPGPVLVSVASDSLIDRQVAQAEAEGPVTVELPVTEAWGAGAYVVASHIRPLDAAAGRNPSRAVGVAWIAVDPGARQLDVAFTSEEQADPRGTYTARLTVDGAAPGDTVYATVAAVDVGILNLTGFDVPDPEAHYLGQRRLGVALRDLYGRLIDGLTGETGRLRSGGDGSIAGAQSPPPTEDLMASFSGVLTVGPDGTLEVPVEIADFNGTVRLSAVVWSGRGVGAASQELLVRDPIVISAHLPRFLGPGDRATLGVDLTHVAGPAGPVSLRVEGDGLLPLPDAPLRATLPEGSTARLSVPLAPDRVGDARITLNLTTPDGEVLTKRLTLGIRALDPDVARQTRLELAAGGTFEIGPELFADLVPGSASLTLASGPLARFDVPGLLTALDRYPYGCTEQLTSRAMPLLYYADLARELELPGADDLSARLEAAVTAVLGNQARDGGFGLWSAGSGDLWLEAYVTDFLSRARAQGVAVPERRFQSALDNLRNRVNAAPDFEDGGEGIAYALMVLAREGAASIGDLRYYADARAENFATPLALAQLGAGLAAYGDPRRADRMFRAAAERLRDFRDDTLWRADYGTDLRDRAAVLALAAEARSDGVDQVTLADQVAQQMRPGRNRSTQEMLWAVLAAHALQQQAGGAGLDLDSAPLGAVARLDEADLTAPRVVSNPAGQPLPLVLTVFGTPQAEEPSTGNGYRIERALFTLEGDPVDPLAVEQNARLVVVLTVRPERPSEARLIVEDPLPAGFEIDNPRLISGGELGTVDWLDLPDIARATSAETTRYAAAVDWRGDQPFRLAYVVRAVSAGDFRHPAASVEDMYRPAYRARTDSGRVVIRAMP